MDIKGLNTLRALYEDLKVVFEPKIANAITDTRVPENIVVVKTDAIVTSKVINAPKKSIVGDSPYIGLSEALIEDDTDNEPSSVGPVEEPEPVVSTPAVSTPVKQTPKKVDFSEKQKSAYKVIKEKMKIQEDKQLGAFLKEWSENKIVAVSGLTPKNIDGFIEFMQKKYKAI